LRLQEQMPTLHRQNPDGIFLEARLPKSRQNRGKHG